MKIRSNTRSPKVPNHPQHRTKHNIAPKAPNKSKSSSIEQTPCHEIKLV